MNCRREKSYQLIYVMRVSHLNDCWDSFHVALNLPQPDPLWTQTVNRLLFNQMLVAALQHNGKQKDSHQESLPSCHQQLGADEENIIRYMAGYIPFKLLKVYKKKDTKEAAEVVDCLSSMVQSGPEYDFYAHTQEWTKAISRGGLFEVRNVAFIFFRRIDVFMRDLLYQHLVSRTISSNDVTEAVTQDDEILFHWDLLSGPLSNEASILLLKEIIQVWTTIREHALAKQLTEQYKHDSGKGKSKSKSFRQDLNRGQ